MRAAGAMVYARPWHASAETEEQMITPTLTRLREQLFDVEARLAVVRRSRQASPAVVAALLSDAKALREEIAACRRRRIHRSAP